MPRRRVLNPDKPVRTKPAIVTLNGDTLMTEWNGLEVGKKFKVSRPGEKAYYFIAYEIDPTREDSPCAWVTGRRVNSRGSDIDQIVHAHCQGGARQELIYAEMIG